MTYQGSEAIAVDGPRARRQLSSSDDHGLRVPGVTECAARGHRDHVHVMQHRHHFLPHAGYHLLRVQIVSEGLLASTRDGAVVLGPGGDLLWREMVVDIDRRLGSQCRQDSTRLCGKGQVYVR